jgi:hypothetical protein
MLTDGQVARGSLDTLECPTSAPFSTKDVGKTITITGAGTSVYGKPLVTTIRAVLSPRRVALRHPAAHPVRHAHVRWGSDDRAAINRALTAIKTHGGGLMLFPPGHTYYCSSTIGSPTQAIGDWINHLTVIGYGATLMSGIVPTGPTGTPPAMRLSGSNVSVLGLTFDWTTYLDPTDPTLNNSEEGDCLMVGGDAAVPSRVASNVLVRDCTFNGAWFAAIRPSFATQVTLDHNRIDRALATGLFAGELQGSAAIVHNTILGTGDDAIFVGCGRAVPQTSRVVIAHNTIRNPAAKGIGVGGIRDVVIQGNLIENTHAQGIDAEAGGTAWDTVSHLTIADNVLKDVGRNWGPSGHRYREVSSCPSAIYMSQSNYSFQNVRIEGNQIFNRTAEPYGDGIHVASVKGLTIAHNRIDHPGTAGISLGARAVPHSVVDFVIAQNHVTGVGKGGPDAFGTGLVCYNADGGTIAGNVFERVGVRAILMEGCDRVAVTNNRLVGDRRTGNLLYAPGCTNLLLDPAP